MTNTSKPNVSIGNCDMIMSLSQSAINTQFSFLKDDGTIKEKWNLVIEPNGPHDNPPYLANLTEEKFNQEITKNKWSSAFNFKIGNPQINIQEQDPDKLAFIIPISSGTIYYLDGRQAAQKDIKESDKVKLAFDVPLKSIITDGNKMTSLDWVYPGCATQFRNLYTSSGLTASDFTIHSLFLDLDNLNYSTFVPQHTHLGPLDANAQMTLKTALGTYFQYMKNKNPYIIGHGAVNNTQTPKAKYQPTALRISATYDVTGGKNLSSVNFCMMTGHRPFPKDQDNTGKLANSLIEKEGNIYFGIDPKFFVDPILEQLGFDRSVTLPAGTKTINLQSLINKKFNEITDGKKYAYDHRTSRHFRVVEEKKVFPPNSVQGKLSKSGDYGYNSFENPYHISIYGTDITSPPSRDKAYFENFQDHTIIVPYVHFFKKELTVKPENTIKLNMKRIADEFGSTPKITTKEYSFPIKTYNFEQVPPDPHTYKFGFAILFLIETISESYGRLSTYRPRPKDTPFGPYSDYTNTTTPPGIIVDISSGHNGKVTVSTKTLNYAYHRSSNNASTASSFTVLHTAIEDKLSDIANQLANMFKNLYQSNIILPTAGDSYKYKNMRFFKDPMTTELLKNNIGMDVTYDPS